MMWKVVYIRRVQIREKKNVALTFINGTFAKRRKKMPIRTEQQKNKMKRKKWINMNYLK